MDHAVALDVRDRFGQLETPSQAPAEAEGGVILV